MVVATAAAPLVGTAQDALHVALLRGLLCKGRHSEPRVAGRNARRATTSQPMCTNFAYYGFVWSGLQRTMPAAFGVAQSTSASRSAKAAHSHYCAVPINFANAVPATACALLWYGWHISASQRRFLDRSGNCANLLFPWYLRCYMCSWRAMAARVGTTQVTTSAP